MAARHRKPATLVLLLLLTAGGALLAQQEQPKEPPFDDVRGQWTIYSKNIEDGQTVEKYVRIFQNHTTLTGHFQGPNQEGGIQGTIHGHHIEFATKTKNVLTFRGEVNGDTMTGNYGLHGKHAEFRAVRTNPNPR